MNTFFSIPQDVRLVIWKKARIQQATEALGRWLPTHHKYQVVSRARSGAVLQIGVQFTISGSKRLSLSKWLGRPRHPYIFGQWDYAILIDAAIVKVALVEFRNNEATLILSPYVVKWRQLETLEGCWKVTHRDGRFQRRQQKS